MGAPSRTTIPLITVRVLGRTGGRGSVPRELLSQVSDELGDRDALLTHGVAVPNGDRVVLQRVEVDGYSVRRPDLVLPAVPPADRTRVIVVDPEVTPERGRHLLCGRHEPLVARE